MTWPFEIKVLGSGFNHLMLNKKQSCTLQAFSSLKETKKLKIQITPVSLSVTTNLFKTNVMGKCVG